jgi:hypothetical protein
MERRLLLKGCTRRREVSPETFAKRSNEHKRSWSYLKTPRV